MHRRITGEQECRETGMRRRGMKMKEERTKEHREGCMGSEKEQELEGKVRR